MRASAPTPRDGEDGWALVSVLWGLVIVSLVAAVMLSSARASYRQAAGMTTRARQQAWAEAATARAVLGLLDSRADHRWRIDGVPQSWSFDGQTLTVSVQDEGGKIDLNVAGTEALRQVMRSARLAPEAVDDAVDKILDWRDQTGDAHRLHGATAADYAAAGLGYRPREAWFQSVDELKLVLGITPALFARIAPVLTVYSGRNRLNPQTMPAAVAALNGTAGQAPVMGGPIVNGVIVQGIPIEGWTFTMRTEAAEMPPATRIVRLTGDPAKPFWFY